jgi:hypothetical protein
MTGELVNAADPVPGLRPGHPDRLSMSTERSVRRWGSRRFQGHRQSHCSHAVVCVKHALATLSPARFQRGLAPDFLGGGIRVGPCRQGAPS